MAGRPRMLASVRSRRRFARRSSATSCTRTQSCSRGHTATFASTTDRSPVVSVRIARVAADPASVPGAGEPGGWRELAYLRLHGSPRIYYSAYEPEMLSATAERLAGAAAAGIGSWCIFDNTAAFAATANALTTRMAVLGSEPAFLPNPGTSST